MALETGRNSVNQTTLFEVDSDPRNGTTFGTPGDLFFQQNAGGLYQRINGNDNGFKRLDRLDTGVAFTLNGSTYQLSLLSPYYVGAQGAGVNTVVRLPAANTVPQFHTFYFVNTGSVPFAVADFSGNTLAMIPSGCYGYVVIGDNSTINGSWFFQIDFPMSEYSYAEDETATATTSTTYQTKVLITTPTISAGRYRASWTYVWGGSNTGVNFNGRVMLDGTTQLHIHGERPSNAGTDQLRPLTSWKDFDLVTGVHTLALQYASASGLGSARIQGARLTLNRIA